MDLGLTGKVALVTGGSEGIGKAAALSMVAEGAKATICARREDVLNAAADEIRAATGGEVLAVTADEHIIQTTVAILMLQRQAAHKALQTTLKASYQPITQARLHLQAIAMRSLKVHQWRRLMLPVLQP